MELSEYRKLNYRDITLPSGLTGKIRMPTVRECMEFPEVFRVQSEGGTENFTREDNLKFNASMGLLCVTKCFTPEWPDIRIVDKPENECGEKELSIEAITLGDQGAIKDAITEWTSEIAATAEEAEKDPTFPAGEAAADGEAASSGDVLQNPATPDEEPNAGGA